METTRAAVLLVAVVAQLCAGTFCAFAHDALPASSAPAAVPAPAAVTAPAAVPGPAVGSASASVAADGAESVNFGRFGAVSVYRGSGTPRNVVLFLSGDGGWNLGVISMAQRLAVQGAVVAGIDIRHYLAELEKASEACVSPSDDFANLSRFLQSKLALKSYLEPTLVGYSSGATLVYATLAQAPEALFKGALSIGFCPDLDLKKPVCRGSGIEATARRDTKGVLQGVNFLPAKKLSGKWISLQGELDQVCPAPATQKFIALVPGAEVVLLPKVGHGYSVERNWVPQYEAAYRRITRDASTAPAGGANPVADLPLTVIPAARAAKASINSKDSWFGIFLSGDGGWVGLDRGVSHELAKHDIPIVGWDSLKYFWSPRTPQGVADDLDRVVRHYAQQWGKSHVLLIGYSQGADILPFMINRLPAATRDMVGYTTLLGISDNALFEFHVANWLGKPAPGVPTAPELSAWSGSPYLCLYGQDDGDAACEKLTGRGGVAVKLAGGHHFGGSYARIAGEILSHLPQL